MPKLWQQYLAESNNRERKSALLLLMEIVGDGNESLCDEALELAADNGRTDAGSIRQYVPARRRAATGRVCEANILSYYMVAKPEHHPSPLVLSSNPTTSGYVPDLAVYDNLFAYATGLCKAFAENQGDGNAHSDARSKGGEVS
jgi:hypothetical protein